MNRDERIVVVGAGLTGLRAAERLRELRFEGEIMLLGDEKLPPYHRPALSKQLLMGALRSSDLTLPAYEDLNAKWRFGTQVRQLVPHNKVLHLPGGEELTYDGLVIATGVEAKRPNDLPYYDPRVLVLRTMSDGMDLERVIGSTKGRVAVIGGGFTGCEIAASLRHLSREVTLIGRQDTLLGNVLGPELGAWLTNLHRDHGVDLALGNSVQDWSPGPEGIGLRLTDGTTLLASCVVVAAGTVPLTGWLRGSGLPLDNGVVCEPTCHVVGAEDVVAAGDVAQWPNLRFDNVPRRVEHWLNAVEMGRAAAESLLAGRAAAEPFTPMPRFWTEQYGVRIQAAGMPKLGKDIITLGTHDEGTGTVYGYSKEGRLMGVVGLDCPSSVLAWTDSVSRQNPAPRPRTTPATAEPAVTVGGQKRGKGRHSLPTKDKKAPREEKREHEIAYVEEPEVGVGAGPVVGGGRPKNVVDSFSRMLPVKVRVPGAGPIPPGGSTNGPSTGGMPRVGSTTTNGGMPRVGGAASTGGMPRVGSVASTGGMPPVDGAVPRLGSAASNGGMLPVPDAVPRIGGAVTNGGMPPVSGAGVPAPVLPPSVNGRQVLNGRSASASMPSMKALPLNGTPSLTGVPPVPPPNVWPGNGAPVPRFAPPNGRPALGPATSGRFPVPPPPDVIAPPQFRSATGTPEPLSGRLTANDALAIDVTGQMALLDANGHVRPPEFHDPLSGPPTTIEGIPPILDTDHDFPPPPPARRNLETSTTGMPPARRNDDSYGDLPPARRNPATSGGMPPAHRNPATSSGTMHPVRRNPEASVSGMPPVRRGDDSFGDLHPVRRNPEASASGMRPVGRGDESFGDLPAVRRNPEASASGMRPVRRGDESFGDLPPVRRNPEASVSGMPPVRRGDESFGGMPPARRGPEVSSSGMPPVRRRTDNSSRGLPPARRSAEVSSSEMSPVRREAAVSSTGMSPVRRDPQPSSGGMRRDPSESFRALPPALRNSTPPARRGSDGAFARGTARGPQDPFASLHDDDSLERTPPVGGSLDETTVDGMPPAHHGGAGPTNGGRAARRRAQERASRTMDPALSGMRLVPALPSMDETFDRPARHSLSDEDYLVRPRSGPEDSYGAMPAVERSAGGRRRA
jgi:NADPH-dependent 2,4-dienoyl-CoA reductase/sulfur reductase-like enzyme